MHRLIRTGRALFTAHTNADCRRPGVSDALAEALGLTVAACCHPVAPVPTLDKWVVYVPARERRRGADRRLRRGRRQIGNYSSCSWSVSGTGQFLPHDGATPAIGGVGTVERVAEDRVEVVAPAPLRAAVLAALRGAHPYEEPAFDVSPWRRCPPGSGSAASRRCRDRSRCATFVARVARALPATSWGVRAAGDPDAGVAGRGVRRRGGLAARRRGAAGVQAYLTADLRHHPADEHRRASDVALVDVAHWASEYPWCGQAAALLRSHFGDTLPVRVSRDPHRPLEYWSAR